MANVLCVVAHPDDEVLGCGGTLAKHAEQGDDVRCYMLVARDLNADALRAARALGIRTGITSPTYLDQRLDTYPFIEVVGLIENQRTDPDIIYTHHPGDLNLDHALTGRAVLTAFRPKPGEKPRTILACEVLSSTEYTYPRVFQPNWYVSLTFDHLDKAWAALECYESEIQTPPHPRSKSVIRARMEARGSEVGVEYAEAFQLLRGGPF